MKITLHCSASNRGAFDCAPAQSFDLAPERVLCNDVVLPWERHPHNVRLWVVGNEFGAVCAVWASHEQDALDEMVDSGLGDSFLVSEEDQAGADEAEKEDWAHLGNASEPADLTYAWIREASLNEARDCRLLCQFAEARGACADSLDR